MNLECDVILLNNLVHTLGRDGDRRPYMEGANGAWTYVDWTDSFELCLAINVSDMQRQLAALQETVDRLEGR